MSKPTVRLSEADFCPLTGDGSPGTRKPRSEVCPGLGTGGTAPPCCDRAGEYNGFGSDGPHLFRCPKPGGCMCHD